MAAAAPWPVNSPIEDSKPSILRHPDLVTLLDAVAAHEHN